MKNPVRKRTPKRTPRPGTLAYFRRHSTGFSETRFGVRGRPTRHMLVPSGRISGTLPKGSFNRGTTTYIPVSLKRNPRLAAQKDFGRRATEEKRRKSGLL